MWIDDCLIVVYEDRVKAAREQMKEWLGCDDVVKLMEYVGCK